MSSSSYKARLRKLKALVEHVETSPVQKESWQLGIQDHLSNPPLDLRIDTFLAVHHEDVLARQKQESIVRLSLQEADFVCVAHLGASPFGKVDAARCQENGGIYAVKTMAKAAVQRNGMRRSVLIERQIHLLARLTSAQRRIPCLFAAFQSESNLTLVTDYAECGSLWDRLCQLGRDISPAGMGGNASGYMSEDEIYWWAGQMVEAIQWVHKQGFVHRDVKPHNFVIDRSANLLLTDFGSAAPLLDVTSATHKEHAVGKVPWRYCEQPVGTPDYIAPEVLQIAEEAFIVSKSSLYPQDDLRAGYDAAVDWWSLGATLFEMAFGCSPFYSATIAATYAKIIACPNSLIFPATPSLSNQLLHLITCLLQPRTQRLFGPEILGLSSPEQGGQRVEEARARIAGHLLPIGLHDDDTLDSLCGSDFSLPCVESFGLSEMDSPRPGGVLDPPSHRWIGWTWHPSSNLMSQQAVERTQQNSPLPSTPHRKLGVISKTPERRRAPPSRSPLRARVMSKQAEAGELLQCVQASASKRRGQTAAILDQFSSTSLQHDLTKLNRGIQMLETRFAGLLDRVGSGT